MIQNIRDIAKLIDHSLLHPTMTDDDIRAGCVFAKEAHVASVCVKPYAVKLAAEILEGSDVAVGTVVGFPHGNSTVEIKVAEAERACDDGAGELDMVVNVAKVLGGDFDYVEREIAAVAEVARDRSFFSEDVRERIVVDSDGARLAPGRTRGTLLTPREKEVLGYIAKGLSKKEIAGFMNVGVKTVEKHAENLMAKLGIHDRVELALYAVREGLVKP